MATKSAISWVLVAREKGDIGVYNVAAFTSRRLARDERRRQIRRDQADEWEFLIDRVPLITAD